MRISTHAARALAALSDFCFPGQCAVCYACCATHLPLCERCSGFLHDLEIEGACRCCGMPLPIWEAPCPYCRGRGRGRIKRILRLGRYVEPLRGLIHAMKYHRRWTIGEHLADRLLEDVAVRVLLEESEVLVPVPLHWRRQVRRGYNQSSVVAEQLAKRTGRSVVQPALRVRDTPTQTGLLALRAREANLRGAFALAHPGRIAGKRVVLVDDVLTSGATLKTLARTLWPARPARISAIVLAVADPRGRGFEAL